MYVSSNFVKRFDSIQQYANPSCLYTIGFTHVLCLVTVLPLIILAKTCILYEGTVPIIFYFQVLSSEVVCTS